MPPRRRLSPAAGDSFIAWVGHLPLGLGGVLVAELLQALQARGFTGLVELSLDATKASLAFLRRASLVRLPFEA
jgi:sugar phosphate isomerase/epimerase